MQYATSQDVIQCDKKTAFSQLADNGFDGIELVIPDGIHEIDEGRLQLNMRGLDPLSDEIWSAKDRKVLQRKSTEADIDIPSICLSFLNVRSGLTSTDPNERDQVRDLLCETINAASSMSIPVILVPFFYDAEIKDVKTQRRVENEICKIKHIAEKSNVTLGLETNLSASENIDLLSTIDSSAVQLYYDIGNAAWNGYDPASEIRTLGDSIVQIHVKDRIEGESDVLLGEGHVPFERVSNALEDIGYDGWIVLETVIENDPIKDTCQNLEFIKDSFE